MWDYAQMGINFVLFKNTPPPPHMESSFNSPMGEYLIWSENIYDQSRRHQSNLVRHNQIPPTFHLCIVILYMGGVLINVGCTYNYSHSIVQSHSRKKRNQCRTSFTIVPLIRRLLCTYW